MTRTALIAAALVLIGCSGSGARRSPDGAPEPRDAAPYVPDDGTLGRACEPSVGVCTRLETIDSFETDTVPIAPDAPILHGIAATEDRVGVLYTHRFPMDEDHYVDTGRLVWSTLTVPEGVIRSQSDSRTFEPASVRGDVATSLLGVLFAARVPVYEGSGTTMTTVGFETILWNDGSAVAESLHIERFTHGSPATNFDAAVLPMRDEVWVASSTSQGISVSQLGNDFSVQLPSDGAVPAGNLEIAAVDEERFVVAWSEEPPEGGGWRARAALVNRSGGIERVGTVFDGAFLIREDVHLVVLGGTIYLGRFDRDVASLRDSRFRVSTYDSRLERVGLDRWLGGWGGLVPSGVAMVAWREAVWAVIHTLDARLGLTPALYIQPLPGQACGQDISTPASVFPTATAAQSELVVTVADNELWIAATDLTVAGTATLLRATSCD